MKKINFLLLLLLSSFSVFSQRHFIYVEKYIDNKLIESSSDELTNFKISLITQKNDTIVLDKEGPVFVYTLLKSVKAVHIQSGKMNVAVLGKKFLRNKTLVIRVHEKSKCDSSACKVYYDNGGYISILQKKGEGCCNEIYFVKPTFFLQNEKWVSRYLILLPYQTGQIK